ncbi:MAG TPA: GspH/FimT family pseudopilin [Gemmatimonadaceae bacterium]|nr:GspH/FimT family pseudopilin [Gemmatimonadaceae bacterium]
MRSNRRAFTIIEILIVVMIVGILMAISLPKLGTTRVRLDARAAQRRVASALGQARALAIQNGRSARFVLDGNVIKVVLEKNDGTWQSIVQQDLSATEGVTVESTRDTLSFDPRGLALSNAGGTRIVITKGTYSDSVCVLGLGKILSDKCSLSQ